MAKTPGGSVRITHGCFICRERANCAHGNAYSVFWLCNKHHKEFIDEEKILKGMVEIQALVNIKKRYLSES